MAIATGDVIILKGSLASRKCFVLPITDGDDYMQIDAAAVARGTANDAVGTFSAWINADNIAENATIVTFADKSVEEYVALDIQAGLVTCRIVDAAADQFTTQADEVHIVPHKWHHIACVQRANGNGPELYVDGVRIAATNDVSTDVDEWIINLDGPLDSGRIGAANMVGDDTVTQEFAGAISDVKYWNRALSALQVKMDFQGRGQPAFDLDGTTDISDGTYLQNHWSWDDLTDKGLGNDPATVVSAVYLDPAYSELTSLCRHFSVVVADVGVSLSVDGDRGIVLVPKA